MKIVSPSFDITTEKEMFKSKADQVSIKTSDHSFTVQQFLLKKQSERAPVLQQLQKISEGSVMLSKLVHKAVKEITAVHKAVKELTADPYRLRENIDQNVEFTADPYQLWKSIYQIIMKDQFSFLGMHHEETRQLHDAGTLHSAEPEQPLAEAESSPHLSVIKPHKDFSVQI